MIIVSLENGFRFGKVQAKTVSVNSQKRAPQEPQEADMTPYLPQQIPT